jgi:protein-disulfide isomerase
MSLRTLAVIALAAFAAACSQAAGTSSAPVAGDSVLGDPASSVTVVEYGAPTCPSCKGWHDAFWKDLKSTYIDTKKIRFVFRELPSHNPPVDAAIFSVARCSGQENFFKVIDLAFERQAQIEAAAQSGAARDAVIALGKEVGLDAAKVEACMKDPANRARIQEVQASASAKGVTGTPTFFVNDVMVQDARFPSMAAKIEEALTASAAAPAAAPATPAP